MSQRFCSQALTIKRGSARQGETAFLKYKANPLSNGHARKLDQFIPERLVRPHQHLVGSDRLIEILLALAVLLEDFPPSGRDENAMVVTECLAAFSKYAGIGRFDKRR